MNTSTQHLSETMIELCHPLKEIICNFYDIFKKKELFLFLRFYFSLICMDTCICMEVPMKPRGLGSLQAEITGSSEIHEEGERHKPESSGRAVGS